VARDENENGFVRVTNTDIYRAVQQLEKRVGRLEVAFFGILAGVGTVLGRLLA
jgi:hypothetical protein